jgi:hypothetical protein
MMKRLGTAGRLVLVAALALLLTGCLKLDMDLQLQTDDTVNGTIVLAVSKDILELTGGSVDDLIGSDTPFPEDIEGVTTEDYDEGDWSGKQFNFDGVPISEFSDSTDEESLQIVRSGDTFEVSGVLDLSSGLSGATGATGASQFLESAELRVAITFPGEVIDANGSIDGNTVTWEPEFGERLEIQATGSAIASGGAGSSMMWILIGVGAVVVVAIVIAVLMSRKKKGAPAAPSGFDAAPAVPPAAPPVAETPAAPAAPEAPPAAPAAPEAPPAAPEPPSAPPATEDEGGSVPPPPPPSQS